jgi:hypothetical protein
MSRQSTDAKAPARQSAPGSAAGPVEIAAVIEAQPAFILVAGGGVLAAQRQGQAIERLPRGAVGDTERDVVEIDIGAGASSSPQPMEASAKLVQAALWAFW